MDTIETTQTPAVGADGFLTPNAGDANPAEQTLDTGAPPTKRGPGRPKKNPTLAAETPGAAPKVSAKPLKRGAKMTQEQQTILARQLQGLHMAAVMVTKIGELQISDDEAKMLAIGISDVCEEYGLSLDGKTGAAVSLMGTAAMIYVPRYFAMQQRIKRESQQGVSDATVVR